MAWTKFGASEALGTIEVGKYANLIAVPGNPLDDTTVLESVSFVMKEGHVMKYGRAAADRAEA